jgi:hypothetical protein
MPHHRRLGPFRGEQSAVTDEDEDEADEMEVVVKLERHDCG